MIRTTRRWAALVAVFTALAAATTLAATAPAFAVSYAPTGTLTMTSTNWAPGQTVTLTTTAQDTSAPGFAPGITTVEWWLYSDTSIGDTNNFSSQYPGNVENKIFLGESRVPATGTTTSGTWTTAWPVPTNGQVTVTRDGESPGGLATARTYRLPTGTYHVQSHLQNAWWAANMDQEPGKTPMVPITLNAGSPTPTPTPTPSPTTTTPPPASGLVVNGGLEQGTGTPTCMMVAGWGDGTKTQGFNTTDKHGGTRSWSLALANRTQGDFKLMLSDATGCAPTVTPGQRYTISVWYKSTATVNGLTLFRQDTSGNWSYWTDLKTLPAVGTWSQATGVTPAVPTGTTRVSFGLSVASNGTLLTDDYAMCQGTAPCTTTPTPTPSPTTTTAPPPPPPPGQGTWTTANYTIPHRFVHATLLKTGKVLMIAGSGNLPSQFNAGSFTASLYDPIAGTFQELTVPNDMFCSGHVTLADGRVLILGGTKAYPNPNGSTYFMGLKTSYIFDPATNTFNKVSDAQTGHWYPTLTKLGNGDVWAAGGLNEVGEGTVATEIFSNASKSWLTNTPQTYSYWGEYEHMILLQDGRLFYDGAHTFGNNLPGSGADLYDINAKTIQDVPGLRLPNMRDQAGSALLPPAQDQRVAIFGGGDTQSNAVGTNFTDVIDLKAASPAYHAAADIPGPGKGYVNTVILPNRTVLTTGGAQGNRGTAVHTTAVFNPVTETWTAQADDPNDRGYHATAVLIPDGRVIVMGGNPADNSFDMNISIFTPSYFTAARPTITGSPATLGYGASTNIGVTGPVQYVSLLAPMSVTHQTDPNSRLVDVPFTTNTDGTLRVTLTSNRNLIPPGPYLLVVQDANGTPSVAKWVTVQ